MKDHFVQNNPSMRDENATNCPSMRDFLRILRRFIMKYGAQIVTSIPIPEVRKERPGV